MKRLWVPLDRLEVFDDKFHLLQADGTWIVNEENDGQSKEKHVEGINYIKGVLSNGQKVMPILVADNEDGTYKRLDGFKRCIAHIELGYKFIEAFVCSPEEFRRNEEVEFGNHKMRAWYGGQEKEHYGLFEGGERESAEYEKTKFLYNSPHGDGLKIELSECIHVHWGVCGKYRLALGRRDFIELAKAVSSIE